MRENYNGNDCQNVTSEVELSWANSRKLVPPKCAGRVLQSTAASAN